MNIGVPKERHKGEKRVALTPETVKKLATLGFTLYIEKGAGANAGFSDTDYRQAGAQITAKKIILGSDIIYKINPPSSAEIEDIKPGALLVSFIYPAHNKSLVEELNAKNISILAMDMVPRISRAQSMDALSSIANLSGYRAVIEAAHALGRLFSGQITAAGKIPPAKVLVIGAGVAGLAAIGTASSLGAEVKAFDARKEVAEQIQSVGGEFLTVHLPNQNAGGRQDGYVDTLSDAFIEAEMALFAKEAPVMDVIITTAAIPGKKAPILLTKEMIDQMRPGSVIVDLAAPSGGNCAYTAPGEKVVTDRGVIILGYTDLASRLPAQASQLYATNLYHLTALLSPEKNGSIQLTHEDPIIRTMLVSEKGEILYPPPPIQVSQKSTSSTDHTSDKKAPALQSGRQKHPRHPGRLFFISLIAFIAALFLGSLLPETFLSHFMVFVLSCIVGYYVIWNVSHSLHTPLMAETNAISGIIIVGTLLQMGSGHFVVSLLAWIGILLVSINIFGGFAVTARMLKMFRKG